jgi:tRNA threonylcarbamoyladenosine biosynthesis protein TsaB
MATTVQPASHGGTSVPSKKSRERLLAIDTSTEQAGIALFDGEQLAEMSWPGGRQQTTTVLPAIETLLARLGIDMSSVGAIAVATGPGSFTGLRVGLSLAKGYAIAGNCNVIGVPTLDVAAEPWREAGVGCIVLVPAGRGRVVWSVYPVSGPATEPRNDAFEVFLEGIGEYPDLIVAGELTNDHRSRLAERHARISSTMATRRPGALATIGYRRWQAGEIDDPTTLVPVYLHGQPNPR